MYNNLIIKLISFFFFLYIFVLFLYFIILIILSAFDSFFLNTYVFNNYINIEIFVLFLTN